MRLQPRRLMVTPAAVGCKPVLASSCRVSRYEVSDARNQEIDLRRLVFRVLGVSGLVAEVKPSRDAFLIEFGVRGSRSQIGVQAVSLLRRCGRPADDFRTDAALLTKLPEVRLQ